MGNLLDLDGSIQSARVNKINWINGYLYVCFACGILLFLMSGCAPADAATMNPNATIAKSVATEVTPPPTATPTPEPTATHTTELTPTVESTKTSNQWAESVGLDAGERSYVVEERAEGTYLVDTYNKAPKAVKQEDGTWRRLDYHNNADAETMYGHLTPPDPELLVTRNHYRNKGITPPDTVSQFLRLSINPVYTGDWVQREAAGPEGQQLTLTYLVTTWRDDTGGLRVMEVGVMAEAPDETFDLSWMCLESEGVMEAKLFTKANEFLEYLKPGIRFSQVDLPFVEEGKIPKVPDFLVSPGRYWRDWDASNALPRLAPWLMSRSTDGQLTVAEARQMNKTGIFTDRVLVSYAFDYYLSSTYDLNGGCP